MRLVNCTQSAEWRQTEAFPSSFPSEGSWLRDKVPGSDLTLAKHSLVASVQRAISTSQVWGSFTAAHYLHSRFLKYQIEKKITRIGYGVGIAGLRDSCLWRRLCCIRPSKFALPLTCPVAHCRTLVHTVSPLPPRQQQQGF